MSLGETGRGINRNFAIVSCIDRAEVLRCFIEDTMNLGFCQASSRGSCHTRLKIACTSKEILRLSIDLSAVAASHPPTGDCPNHDSLSMLLVIEGYVDGPATN